MIPTEQQVAPFILVDGTINLPYFRCKLTDKFPSRLVSLFALSWVAYDLGNASSGPGELLLPGDLSI